MKLRTLGQLNPVLVAKDMVRCQAILDACNIANDMTASSTPKSEYLIGDRVLCKLNLLSKRQVRRGLKP